MDYAFAPGGTPYDVAARVLLGRMPNVTVIQAGALAQPLGGPDSFDIAAFVDHLNSTAAIPKPIGHLIIATHGNASGWMAIDLDRVSVDTKGNDATETTYEVLDQAVASGSVAVPAALHANPPDPAIPFDVHIRGCRIGQQPTFVQRLKTALVRARSVTVPRHFHLAGAVGSRRRRSRYGSYECLFYSFQLSRIERPPDIPHDPAVHHFRNHAEAVTQFHLAGFTFIDASDVPEGLWRVWIPRRNLRPRSPRRSVRLGQNVGRNLTRLPLGHEWRVRDPLFPYKVRSVDADPGNPAQRETVLRNSIEAHPIFQEGHPFPLYQRLGFADRNAFLDGHRWGCVWNRASSELRCVGRRREYTVIVPVLDPATDPHYAGQHLFFNLFPVAGQGLRQVDELNRGDDRLFLTV